MHDKSLADSGGAQGARAPPFEIPKRVFKRDPPKTFAPAALAVAAVPPPPFPKILDPPLQMIDSIKKVPTCFVFYDKFHHMEATMVLVA